jgi:hypothetical protein
MRAICGDCKRDMRKAEGCLQSELFIDGKWYQRRTDTPFDTFMPNERCHDCGAEPGHFHHWKCDAERCPKCGGQLISCSCKVTEIKF